MKCSQILAIILALISLSVPACQKHEDESESEDHKIVVTSPLAKDVTLTQQYVCQIHAQRYITVRALESGYLQKVSIGEGQLVKTGDPMFEILPTLHQAKLDAENAEARLAKLELDFTKSLRKDNVVSPNEVELYEAKLARATAKAKLAKREYDFTKVTAPFTGIVDHLHEREGSLIKEKDVLTTLSDNSVMWVYFNVPEVRYLEYMATQGEDQESQKIELKLANGNIFRYRDKSGKIRTDGSINAIEAKFNNETGNIAFRADFPNPDRLLRHGQTGNILIHRTLKNAIVIPQRATFDILDKRYVYVIDKDGVVHQREIFIQNELPDIFVIMKGVDVNDKIILEGVRQVREGDKREFEFRKPEAALANQKQHAE